MGDSINRTKIVTDEPRKKKKTLHSEIQGMFKSLCGYLPDGFEIKPEKPKEK